MQKVVSIDDEFETEDTGYLEHIIGELAQGLDDDSITEFESMLPEVSLVLEPSIWTEQLRTHWESLDASQRWDLGRSILKVLGRTPPDDLGRLTALKEYIGEDNLIESYSSSLGRAQAGTFGTWDPRITRFATLRSGPALLR